MAMPKKVELIEKKLGNSEINYRKVSEIKKILTDEELVIYLLYQRGHWMEIVDGDEYLILQILRLISKKNYNTRYSRHLLDVAKDLISQIATFTLNESERR